MQAVCVLAPCKANLFLEVAGRRGDGYHLLCSVMQAVDFYERIHLQPLPSGIRLQTDDPALPLDGRNTAFRAARAFLESTGLSAGVAIRVEKRVPYQAGLGSASADAAGVLWGLDQLFGTGLPAGQLARLGQQVGADVPFCLSGGAALAGGIGEALEPLPPAPGWLLVAKPAGGFATAEIFARFDQLPPAAMGDGQPAADALRQGDLAALGRCMFNRLQQCLPPGPTAGQVALLCRRMGEEGALGSCMTGSGSAVVGLFESRQAACRARERLSGQAAGCWVVRPVAGGPRRET